MTRKLLPLAFVLGLVAAACAEPPNPEIDFGSGLRFVPLVADSLNNAGVDPSIVANGDGLPVVAYFAFPEEVPEGTFPAARPVDAPTIPGVLMARASEEGLWTRGAMALEAQIPSVQVPFNPAFEESVADLTSDNVTGLRMVALEEEFHAVWGSRSGVFYASGSLDPDAADQVKLSKVTGTPRIGPSIAVDGDGAPSIAFYTSTSETASVELATPSGDDWAVQTVAETRGCDACRTAVMAGADGVAVAYSDGGSGVSIATGDGENGWVSTGVSADGGQGLSGVATGDGFALSFYDPAGQVTVATGTPGSFAGTPAAEVAADAGTEDGAGTSIAVAEDGTLWVAWADVGGVGLASGDGAEFSRIDTGTDTSGGAMPSVAVAPGDGNTYLSWYDTESQDLLVGAFGDLGALAIAGEPSTATPAGATGPTTVPPPAGECTPVEDGVVTITAQSIAFDLSCIEARAGEPFEIEFVNDDDGIPHNVAIYPSADEVTPDAALFQGDIFNGVQTMTYQVDALEAGEYFFRCDVHPTQMTGTFRVTEGAGGDGGGEEGGGGGDAFTVTAQNIAFDTGTIALTAGQETALTFVNDDAGVPHNVAIYPSPDQVSPEAALFQGEIFPGPDRREYAIPPLDVGEYYFICDVHPTQMTGTVVVE